MKENKTPLYIFAYYLSSVPVILTHISKEDSALLSSQNIKECF